MAKVVDNAEKEPIFGVFLVCIFPHSDKLNTERYGVFVIPNARKYGPEKLRIQTLFTHDRMGSKYASGSSGKTSGNAMRIIPPAPHLSWNAFPLSFLDNFFSDLSQYVVPETFNFFEKILLL